MWLHILCISLGAACGALLRWTLGIYATAATSPVPTGTLLANWLGAYLIGVALAVFAALPELPVAVRLMVITGFLGSLTTFSSFSAEMVQLLQTGRFSWALLGIFAHVLGSLLWTFGGIGSVVAIRHLTRAL